MESSSSNDCRISSLCFDVATCYAMDTSVQAARAADWLAHQRGLLSVIEARDPPIRHIVDSLEAGEFKGLLQAAVEHEARGELRAAAATYRTALQSIPRFLSPSARAVLEHAKAVVDANDAALETFLAERLAPLRARHA